MRSHNYAVISVGANLPRCNRGHGGMFRVACQMLHQLGYPVVASSSLYKTPAWPAGSRYPDYTNAIFVLRVQDNNPTALMRRLLHIERLQGRHRRGRYAPRVLDLDIVDFAGRRSHTNIPDAPLQLPHPRMDKRAFVLVPLAEIWPNWRHPISGENIANMLAKLDVSVVQPLTFEPFLGQKWRLPLVG